MISHIRWVMLVSHRSQWLYIDSSISQSIRCFRLWEAWLLEVWDVSKRSSLLLIRWIVRNYLVLTGKSNLGCNWLVWVHGIILQSYLCSLCCDEIQYVFVGMDLEVKSW